jgi:hypothetical protein
MPKLWLSSPVGARFNDNEAQGAEQESLAPPLFASLEMRRLNNQMPIGWCPACNRWGRAER